MCNTSAGSIANLSACPFYVNDTEWPLERIVSMIVPVFFGIIGLIGLMGNALVIIGKWILNFKHCSKDTKILLVMLNISFSLQLFFFSSTEIDWFDSCTYWTLSWIFHQISNCSGHSQPANAINNQSTDHKFSCCRHSLCDILCTFYSDRLHIYRMAVRWFMVQIRT